MTINGLSNDYYLARNDIWVKVDGFTEPTSVMEIVATNITTGVVLQKFKLSASPQNDYQFNISQIVRALFPEQNHIINNALQIIKFDFTAIFVDTSTADEELSVTKYFLNGGRNQNRRDEWFLNNGDTLIVGSWIEWLNIELPGFAHKIQDGHILEFIPTNPFKINVPHNCDHRILKFRNSLGGYQYYVFEKFEIKSKVKPGKTIQKIADRLRKENFRNIEPEVERTITFYAKTPFACQEVITELIASPEVWLYRPEIFYVDSRWELLKLEGNESIENNWQRVYDNSLEFTFSKYYK